MALTLVLFLVAISILSSSDGSVARSNVRIHRELLQQNAGSGNSIPTSGGGFGLNPAPSPISGSDPATNPESPAIAPTDPTQPGIGSGSTDPTQPGNGSGSSDPTQPGFGSGPAGPNPSIPDIPDPGSSPIDPPAGPGSCDFWSSHFGSWPHILSTMSSIISAFGQPAYPMFPSGMTLLQALQSTKTDSYSSLLKQASASLLNAYAYKNFVFSPDDVKRMFAAALISPEAAASQASVFAHANLGLK